MRLSMAEARYCEKHKRLECTKRAKNAEDHVCHGSAIAGLDACRLHSGFSAEVARARGQAFTAFNAVSDDPTVDPSEVMAKVMQVTFLRWAWLAGMLGDQTEQDSGERVASGEVRVPGPTGGLVGFTFGPTGITGEAPRGLVILEAAERERAARFAKAAHDMGIRDREIRLAENQAAAIVNIINGVLSAVGLTPDQAARVPDAVAAAMQRLELLTGEPA